ncbi:hypothetical protein HYG86_07495 [Alkalicella caledoniensis]|uniref:Phytol kinase n=1 Tax=Alkalicella caledoniensis TaxID=2731377 RepID=A0A7G9W7H7_ALKCA|nr:diacylglycerol/polyprenol kinase family protein [Alkalicella caledoniensis]QNO14639.1 hypothetical protein HYG86_07495 [Alkalicella caledoniensis]
MSNFWGIAVSIVFVLVVIGTSEFLGKKQILSNEGTRKFVHIGVANWWFIAMYFFDNKFYAAIVPAIFVIVNYISYKQQIFKSIERNSEENSLGTVYYAISLLILSLITFSEGYSPTIGLVGIMVMGYGDGLAAVIGQAYGKHKYTIFGATKSMEGTLAMFLSSFIVTLLILHFGSFPNVFLLPFVIAIFATVIESISFAGFDNLTVPLLTSLIYYLLVY